MTKQMLIRDIYDAFQKQELERWKTMIAPDVTIDSPAGRGFKGLDVLTGWAVEFGGKLAYRIDLIDEHLALDAEGNGRGFFTFNLHWKHDQKVFGLEPTGREGTSVETLLLTVRANRVTHIHVGDNSLDLVLYMWDRGWPHPHNVRPEALVVGVERRRTP
jgi:hypothetical protein